uniref:Uncharacterized protein n=1 Tax=Arundo donax TaxID=35708 RepID=A0A0A9GQ21_ARUDO
MQEILGSQSPDALLPDLRPWFGFCLSQCRRYLDDSTIPTNPLKNQPNPLPFRDSHLR